jgi:NAD(P)H-hydrate epimerase
MRFISQKDIKLPKRSPRSHKGDNGRVLVIGGSNDYVGAVALAGLAALRCGADWVTVAVPERVGWAIHALTPDLVVRKYKCSNFSAAYARELLKLEKGFDAVLIGNGIGMRAKQFVKNFISKSTKPLVVDADAIKSSSAGIMKNSIITPHEKELEAFLLNSGASKKVIEKIGSEISIARKSLLIRKALGEFLERGNVVLLKGSLDVVISKNKTAYNKTGNAGMTKAGTGDVLAGLAVGFLAQSNDLFQSAVNAAYFNGLIGDILLKKKKGFTYLASDMVGEIAKVTSAKRAL